jgi:signal transduction histidine kinase
MNPFHSAALKLTLWYLAIVMAVSTGSSVAIYHFSSNDLRRGVQRQIEFYSQVLSPEESRSYSKLRLAQLAADQKHLRDRLLLFNLAVLIGGGLASYWLARKTMRPLEAALDAQTRFTGDASHELRTPLSVMQTEIEVALRDPKLSIKESKNLLQSNLEEIGRLKRLAEGLLALAGQSVDLDYSQSVSVRQAAQLAIERNNAASKAKKIKVSLSGPEVKLRGNQQSLADLINILLDNAIKYSPRGTEVKIETGSRDRRGYLKVIDHGAGIAAKDLPRIFERFYRADSSRSKSQAEGYGLGLAIAKKITDLHHGSIEVKSTLGKGSAFTVYIPRH